MLYFFIMFFHFLASMLFLFRLHFINECNEFKIFSAVVFYRMAAAFLYETAIALANCMLASVAVCEYSFSRDDVIRLSLTFMHVFPLLLLV